MASDLAWTVDELCDELLASRSTIERLTAQGRIPHVKLTPRITIYPKQAIREWLADEAHASTILFELEADGADVPGISGISGRRQGAA